jgi:predicted GH43/DUF377 family glycosyl hydrolase
MKWKKKGQILSTEGQAKWNVSHGMCPTADNIEGDIFRIYYSGRDNLNRSLVGYVDIDINNPEKILCISEEPVLGLGELGTFDDNGVTPIWIINHDNKKYLYYVGWNLGSTVRMAEMSGLAISEDKGESFKRASRAPILGRTDREPLTIICAPCVMKDEHDWKMWYVSGEEWVHKNLIKYNIKYAYSKDGIKWDRDGQVCIGFNKNEYAFARPSVLKEDGIYKMWFSFKNGLEDYRYQMGYAESKDGIDWVRKDEMNNIVKSESGWDSEMVCYPYVFNHKEKKYMLYNGNGYGKSGFGIAVLENE